LILRINKDQNSKYRAHATKAGSIPSQAVSARKRFICSAAIDLPRMQHLPSKQLRVHRHRADHLWHSQRVQKASII